MDVGDSRGFVDFQLALSFPQEKLNGAEVFLVDLSVSMKLAP